MQRRKPGEKEKGGNRALPAQTAGAQQKRERRTMARFWSTTEFQTTFGILLECSMSEHVGESGCRK